MFFAPPKVKSLSRYSEFGSYLEHRHFIIMVLIATTLHLTILAIYEMMPHPHVERIPVRVLNIHLGGGGHAVSMPLAPMTVAQPPQEPVARPKAETRPHEKPVKATKPASKTRPEVIDDTKPRNSEQAQTAETLFPTPKQYVRESEMKGAVAGQGEGDAAGERLGQEITRRYEQNLSLWLFRHKIYPEAARKEGIQGEAVLRLRIDRQGHILYGAIEHSSGSSLIDGAALDMVRASNPAPAVPDDYPDKSPQLEFLIPVGFSIQ